MMDFQVQIADADHPITRGLKDFQIHDETYKNYDTDPAARVLLTTEHPKSDRELRLGQAVWQQPRGLPGIGT